MSGVNKVIIVGRLGKDPEVKQIGQGQTVCHMTVATSENWLDKSGQKQERTEWHRIVVWGKLAEICGKHLAKGRQVYLEGRLQTRSWEDQGQKKYSTEIVANTVQFLGSANNQNEQRTQNQNDSEYNYNDFGPEPTFNANDDIPF